MTATQTEIETYIEEISTKALEAFCDDISNVFNLEVKCQKQDVIFDTIKGLKKHFGKLAAVNNIDSTGFFDGCFQIIFDQDGIFTLGGVLAMQPEGEIRANKKNGSAKLAESMTDAIGEAGNLLVKSWERILEAETEDQSQLTLRLPLIIGKHWQKSTNSIILSKDHELILILYRMTINSFEAFRCGVLFPKAILKDDFNSESEMTIETPEHDIEDDINKQENIKEEAEIPVDVDENNFSEQKTESVKDTNVKTQSKNTGTVKTKTKKSRKTKTSRAVHKMSESPDDSNIKSTTRSRKTKKSMIGNINELLQKTAQDIMHDHIIWVGPEDCVGEVHDQIQQNNVGYALVGRNNALEGIVSKSDLSGAMSPYLRPIFSKWHRPQDDATLKIKIKWVMSKPVHTIKTDTPLEKILKTFKQVKGHALPVVDDQDHVVGMVTDYYIFNTLLNSKKM